MARNRPHSSNVTRNRRAGNRGKMPQYNLKWGVEADEEDSFSVSIDKVYMHYYKSPRNS